MANNMYEDEAKGKRIRQQWQMFVSKPLSIARREHRRSKQAGLALFICQGETKP